MSGPATSVVTPYLIDRAATMCARRLRLTFQGQKGTQGMFARGRVRDPLVLAARTAHADMAAPGVDAFPTPVDLLPEECAVFDGAAAHYVGLFASEPLRAVDHEPFLERTESDRDDLSIGGWIDLVGERPDGRLELRQFELWGRRPDADPLSNPTILLAALRIRKALRPETLAVRHADLVHGRVAGSEVELTRAGALGTLFHQRVARIRLRVKEAQAEPGGDCVTCPFPAGCPGLG